MNVLAFSEPVTKVGAPPRTEPGSRLKDKLCLAAFWPKIKVTGCLDLVVPVKNAVQSLCIWTRKW